MNLKEKMYLYVNSTTQSCPNKIIKNFSDWRFFTTGANDTGAVVHLELQISLQIFEKMRRGPNGLLGRLGENLVELSI